MDHKMTNQKKQSSHESMETRSEAAKKGWESRREHEGSMASNSKQQPEKAQQQQKSGRGNNESAETRSEAAKKGWETRREQEK